MPSKMFEDGMKVRREVLGDAHVDRAEAAKTPFDAEFQHYITESGWGGLWTRPHFDRRLRSIVTLTILATLGQDDEFKMHIRATRNTGASKEDIAEMLMHVATYAGIPAANHGFRLAKQAYADMEAGKV